MYVFIGDFSTNFRHNFYFYFKKRLLCAFVCPSWFKETGGLHSVQRARAPTSFIKLVSMAEFTSKTVDDLRWVPSLSWDLRWCDVLTHFKEYMTSFLIY